VSTILKIIYRIDALCPNLSYMHPIINGPTIEPKPRGKNVKIAIPIFTSSERVFIEDPSSEIVLFIRLTKNPIKSEAWQANDEDLNTMNGHIYRNLVFPKSFITSITDSF
jgi:hypothetical protein